MENRVKNITLTVAFGLFLGLFAVLCVIKFFAPEESSVAERRPLAQFPEEITWEGILDKSVIAEFEDYSVDQFPFREFFRSIKAHFQMDMLQIKENNGLAVESGSIAAVTPKFDEESVDYSLGRLAYVYEKLLKDNGGEKFVAIIPDKNYFFGRDYGYPAPDYEALIDRVQGTLPEMQYINLFPELTLEDYYLTDTHWSQDKLGKVVDKLAKQLGIRGELSGEYEKQQLYPFYGVYYGQSGLNPQPDTITYLTNESLENCTVYDYENAKTYGIYDFEKFGGKDGYEFFLSGTKALLRIDNPGANTDKELILFRDSFGSSLAPLLAEGYKSIYVVDIRYVVPDYLEQFIDFQGKDVLYLYSTLILNARAFR